MTLALFADPTEYTDRLGVTWRTGTVHEANRLLRGRHYLGPMRSGGRAIIVGDRDGEIVACQVWRVPTSRRMPSDGSWLELSRWCLTPEAGKDAGSRCHRASVAHLRRLGVTTVLSYSDPSAGHTGALYRACNWLWAPTWQRLRPPPTGQGSWGGGPQQSVKDRWVFHVAKTDERRALLVTDDLAAVRYWRPRATPAELRWAALSGYLPELPEDDGEQTVEAA